MLINLNCFISYPKIVFFLYFCFSLTGGSESSGNKSSGISLSIRFNAEEESIEELIKPNSSTRDAPPLLNSPQQNVNFIYIFFNYLEINDFFSLISIDRRF